MIVNRPINPAHKKYLPPAPTGTENCAARAPKSVFGVEWYCTRPTGHDGDHAAHHDFGRTGDESPVVMIARWGG